MTRPCQYRHHSHHYCKVERPKRHWSLPYPKISNTADFPSCEITSLHCSKLPSLPVGLRTKATVFTVTTSQVSSPTSLPCPPCASQAVPPCGTSCPLCQESNPLGSPKALSTLPPCLLKAQAQTGIPCPNTFSPFILRFIFQFLIFYYGITFEIFLLHAVPSSCNLPLLLLLPLGPDAHRHHYFPSLNK